MIEYRNDRGQRHRDNDLPAVIWSNGDKLWYKNGQQHRDGDRPAFERNDGLQEWWVNGVLHRDNDLPAIMCPSGINAWWVNGKVHREGGLPAIDGEHKLWWLNGRKLSAPQATAYTSFCQRMQEKKKIKAQKKIYFWWIQICYDMDHPSGCGQRMAQKNLDVFESMMNV